MSSSPAKKDTFPFGQKIAWQPNERWMRESNLQQLMQQHGIASYDELQQRAHDDIGWFWDATLKQLDIQFYTPYSKIVDLSNGIQFPRWCVNGKMNIIHNCLDKWQADEHAHRTALIWESEDGESLHLTYEELHRHVCQCANALKQLGLGKGDAVGLYMPMVPELIIAFLAIIKIGGVILPLFSGYGPTAVISRLQDAQAKAIFTADGFLRRGKPVRMKPVVDEAAQQVSSLQRVIVVERAGLTDTPMQTGRDHWWHDVVPQQSTVAETARTDAEDVLMIIYTSGTTGKPKGAVHTHCGFPIKAAQDMFHPMDVKPGDTMYWMTDMGWMMGPWLVFGTLLIGATIVLYDGAPDVPDAGRVWQQVADHRVSHIGVSPTLIRALKTHGTEPIRRHDASSLRAVCSTGSPWDPESWLWLFENVLDSKKPILNYSGGTEISGGIVCGDFFRPLKPCAFSGPVVGMDADVVDEAGQPVRRQVGELVIRQPWIGMTRGFWNDKQRYLETYWSRFESTWLHGDFAAIDEDGLWYILGRSDDTIKVAGKRLGPAEVESILNAHTAVAESAAIGVPHPVKDNEVVAFCVLKSGQSASEKLRDELMQSVIDELGKPLKPREIKFAKALPKTRNAKVMHRIIRAAYLGSDIGDISSLEDAGTVDAIKNAV
ncbi:MAG: AMP-binding protein [Deferribacteres bacterium]|nr:AMP-binding protein [candidate division KSB1 bacterium]MCB9511285.1 AMP-binding protein [Deferribacteres bacterium]